MSPILQEGAVLTYKVNPFSLHFILVAKEDFLWHNQKVILLHCSL